MARPNFLFESGSTNNLIYPPIGRYPNKPFLSKSLRFPYANLKSSPSNINDLKTRTFIVAATKDSPPRLVKARTKPTTANGKKIVLRISSTIPNRKIISRRLVTSASNLYDDYNNFEPNQIDMSSTQHNIRGIKGPPRYPPLDIDGLYSRGLLVYTRDFLPYNSDL